jgi:hypothetical protein
MSAALADYAALVSRLTAALAELDALARPLHLPPLAAREWYELLCRKLVPQLGDQAFLIVAVTGGTNIGKSVVFNHLAGFRASASSPLASGTKHPVCLVPEGFADHHDLAALFPGFTLRPWATAQEALQDTGEHLLFWRVSAELPANLLVLDTPDIDSDAPVNWQRADSIRHCADVLIAVLTQQKYNDAAVKQFFRKAAAEGKAVVIVFNQCELPDDEAYWPLWLNTFTTETGVVPEYVYLAPSDRKAADALRLPFVERAWPESRESRDESPEPESLEDSSAAHHSSLITHHSLQEVFSRFHFADIKLRTLRGSLALVADDTHGVPSYLREVQLRSGEFRAAADLLTTQQLAEIDDWPAPPNDVLIAEVRTWWATHRQGWSAKVHGVYDAIGGTLMKPMQYARDWLQGPTTPPWERYRQQEWDSIVRAVAKVYGKLEWLSELGNALLKTRLEDLLRGTSRAELLTQLQADHQAIDFAGELAQTVTAGLQSFRTENPQLFQMLKRMDEAAAAARPALTVVLGITGVGLPFGEAAAQVASHSMMQAAMHVAGEVAAGTVAATVGETAISTTASSGVGYVQAKFHRLQTAFTARRAQWLAERLERALLGALATDLQAAAQVSRSAAFQDIASILRDWPTQPPEAQG